MVSEAIDTPVFVTIAFVGISPIFQVMLGQYIAKLVIAVADTVLVYAVVILIRRKFPMSENKITTIQN